MSSPRPRDSRRPLRCAVALVLSLALVEVLIRAAFYLYPPLGQLVVTHSKLEPDLLPDPRLGHRPNPRISGHDAKGFRNARVPERADIIGLGDSQTYGSGVKPNDAWPNALARMTPGATVYNMAYGGWGPGQSLLLWDEATALSPKVVIEAFYAGNDLYDTYRLVYGIGQLPEFKSADSHLLPDLQARDTRRSLEDEINLIKKGKTGGSLDSAGIKQILKQHWRLYATLSALVNLGKSHAEKEPDNWDQALRFAADHARYCIAFDGGTIKTLLTPDYRLVPLNLGDPRIAEGLRISLAAIEHMQNRARDAEIKFLVALIPTKELVFADAVSKKGDDVRSSYATLIANEIEMWHRTKKYLADRDIPFVDLLPPLRAALNSGTEPYRMSDDGHPSEAGYTVIAQSLHETLAALGWLANARDDG